MSINQIQESGSAFKDLLPLLDNQSTVLDVGFGGLEGDNTSIDLLDYFQTDNITGICNNAEAVDLFVAQRNEQGKPTPNFVIDDFYIHPFEKQYDVVVLDLNIDNNVQRDWTELGLENMNALVKKGGYLINYVMLTDQYGDQETPAMIKRRWKDFYKEEMNVNDNKEVVLNKLSNLRNWELVSYCVEERRPTIMWVLMKNL